MAVAARDGSMHHSAGRASLHDEMHSEKKPPVKQMEKPKGDGEKSAMSIEEHVQQHGPAHETHHHLDAATGMHHVVTHHGKDGEEGAHHHSTHKSHEEVHEHLGKAYGLGGEQEETPDNAMEEEQEQQPAGGGGNPFLNS